MNEKCALVIAVVLVASLAILPVYAANAGMNATVLNTAPTVHVELSPDDMPETPGVQVINPDPTTNKTVTITATIADINGYDDIISVVANITGPSIVDVSLHLDSVINVTTAVYKGTFNLSNHTEGDYEVDVTAKDKGGLTGVGSKNFTYLYGCLLYTSDAADE